MQIPNDVLLKILNRLIKHCIQTDRAFHDGIDEDTCWSYGQYLKLDRWLRWCKKRVEKDQKKRAPGGEGPKT